jgi:hypothetical protein
VFGQSEIQDLGAAAKPSAACAAMSARRRAAMRPRAITARSDSPSTSSETM